jgi:hypothetical protein
MMASLVVAVVLVTVGYLALWASQHEHTEKGLAGFGRVMAIILFVFAGLTLVAGAGASHWCMWHMNKGGMGMGMGSCGMMGEKGMEGHHMMGMGMMKEKEEMMEHRDMMGENKEAMSKDMMVAHLKMMKEKNPDLFKQSIMELDKAEKKK